jgi:2-methylisocitrate lyase-like PEP mutase family enzyme
MTSSTSAADAFLALHVPGTPLLLPNAWDMGSARILATEGFAAIATTSSGHAATMGRKDGSMSRDEVLAHCRDLASAVDVPVSADLEHGYASDASGVAETVRLAIGTGLAGCSIEDSAGPPAARVVSLEAATERVAAAAEAAHGGAGRIVLCARAENHLHGVDDLSDTIARLQAYGAAGADVLYAPGLRRPDDIATVVREVSLPVNVLLMPGGPTPSELADLGVARISVGGGFYVAAMGALVEAARAFRDGGPQPYWDLAAGGRAARDAAVRD